MKRKNGIKLEALTGKVSDAETGEGGALDWATSTVKALGDI